MGFPTSIEPRDLTDEDRALLLTGDLDDLRVAELSDHVRAWLATVFKLVGGGQTVTAVADDQVLTSTEAARVLGVSRPFLIKLLDEDRLPYHKAGRDRRIRFIDLRAFIEERDRLTHERAASAATRDDRRAARIAARAGLSVEEAKGLGL